MPLGLYLHIPFCQAICAYCNFNRGLLDPDLKRRYVGALEQEIRRAPRPEGAAPSADTIFFGGGTPSLLDAGEVQRLESQRGQLADLLEHADSPEFLEREARLRLGLQKPGESVLIIRDGAPGTASTAPVNSTASPPPAPSNVRRWWQHFFR